MLETLDYTIRIGSTPTFLYFALFHHSLFKVAPYIMTVQYEIVHKLSTATEPANLIHTLKCLIGGGISSPSTKMCHFFRILSNFDSGIC